MGMATAVPFTVASASPAESERQFEEAMGWIAAGEPDAALPILRRLFRGTRAPRVRLELARALMLSGQTGEARQVCEARACHGARIRQV